MLLLIYSNIKYFFECILEVIVLFCYRSPLTTVQAGAYTTQKDKYQFRRLATGYYVCYLVKLFMNETMNVWFIFDYPHVHISLNFLQDSLNL
jgi:hypothetical protein